MQLKLVELGIGKKGQTTFRGHFQNPDSHSNVHTETSPQLMELHGYTTLAQPHIACTADMHSFLSTQASLHCKLTKNEDPTNLLFENTQ